MESPHHQQDDGTEVRDGQVATPTAAIADLIPELLSAIGDGAVVLSAPSERALWANEQASELLGLDPSLLLRATFADVVAQLAKRLTAETQSQATAILSLPSDPSEPTQGRLVFQIQGEPTERAIDWSIRKLTAPSDRWLLLLRNVTALWASERAHQRTNSVLHNVVDEQQHLLQMIRQLGTPVLPIYRRIVVLPLVGHVDSSRAEHVMDAVLAAIVRYQAAVVLIDITGVTVVDTAVANSLIQTVRAADMIGALSILVGISAEVARSMVHLGVGLDRVVTQRDLQAGIAYALKHTGHAIVRVREEIDWIANFIGGETVTEAESSAASQTSATEEAIETESEPSAEPDLLAPSTTQEVPL